MYCNACSQDRQPKLASSYLRLIFPEEVGRLEVRVFIGTLVEAVLVDELHVPEMKHKSMLKSLTSEVGNSNGC